MTKPRLVVVDRDGVINHDPGYLHDPNGWKPLPGSMEALVALHQAGFLVAVATNQSGVGRGYFSQEQLDAVHAVFLHDLEALGGHIDALEACVHAPDVGCACRKPAPGMLQAIFTALAVEPSQALMVGDSLRDVQAGLAAGCQAALVLTGEGARTFLDHESWFIKHPMVEVYPNLAALVQQWLLDG